ncbi:MAG TPA: outer membrane beta-barrel protein [Bryobacteraceae bacterium]|nr:outer membrane beta-barrel protein [Bryobacteraceae bacterium]
MSVRRLIVLTMLTSCALLAQKWEVGVAGGGSFYTSQEFTGSVASADASFTTSFAASAWLGNDSGRFIGGEVRYDYEASNPQLKGGDTEKLDGQTHAIHYDFLFHFAPRTSRVRPFVAAGAGVKIYRGTGQELAYQGPLESVALLTQKQDLEPMVSVGAGIKFEVSKSIQFRVEVHDYLTPFPTNVITPNVGTKTSGWLQNIVPEFGLSFTF